MKTVFAGLLLIPILALDSSAVFTSDLPTPVSASAADSAAATAAAQAVTCDEILVKVRAQEARKAADMDHLTYLAEGVTLVRNADGKANETIESIRRITRQGKDPDKIEYLEMTRNGRKLSKQEMEAEVAKTKAGVQGKSPFLPEEGAKYDYSLDGQLDLDGRSVYVISYQPKTPGPGLAAGKGYIDCRDFDQVRLEFSPSKPPSIIQHMEGVINCRAYRGFWMPADLSMQIHVKVVFIITLADQQIEIHERYRDYQLPPAVAGQADRTRIAGVQSK
jgi:hypothetical protein